MINRRAVLMASAGALWSTTSKAAGRGEAFDIESLEVNVPSLLPEHDGLRVAQLTDLHIGNFTPDGRLIAAMGALETIRPDLIVLTGDFVTVKRDPVERVGELLSLLPNVPRVAVLGNHDHWTHPGAVSRELNRVGIELLQNENTELQLRGAPFRVIGVDDGHTRHDDPATAFKGVPDEGSRLVLTHTPSAIDRFPSLGLPCLAGHTHGGHFVVPRLTDAVFAIGGERYVRGWYEVGGNQLYVSRGIGAGRGGHFPRVGAEPELSVFTLRGSASSRG